MHKLFGCLLLLSLLGLLGCQPNPHKVNAKLAKKPCCQPALEISADK